MQARPLNLLWRNDFLFVKCGAGSAKVDPEIVLIAPQRQNPDVMMSLSSRSARAERALRPEPADAATGHAVLLHLCGGDTVPRGPRVVGMHQVSGQIENDGSWYATVTYQVPSSHSHTRTLVGYF